MITECRYIPHKEAEKYRQAGWEVEKLNCHHGAYSMLATRKIECGKDGKSGGTMPDNMREKSKHG